MRLHYLDQEVVVVELKVEIRLYPAAPHGWTLSSGVVTKKGKKLVDLSLEGSRDSESHWNGTRYGSFLRCEFEDIC